MPPSYKVLLSFVVLLLLLIPLHTWFGWSAALGYLFGLVMMAIFLLYLLRVAADD